MNQYPQQYYYYQYTPQQYQVYQWQAAIIPVLMLVMGLVFIMGMVRDLIKGKELKLPFSLDEGINYH